MTGAAAGLTRNRNTVSSSGTSAGPFWTPSEMINARRQDDHEHVPLSATRVLVCHDATG